MRRITPAALRGMLVALVAFAATGARSHAQAPAGEPDAAAALDVVAPAATSQDHLDRRIERPLPFLAGQGALESLLEINPRVNLRSTERTGDSIDDGSDTHPASLSHLRLRTATWQQAVIERVFAFASRGTLHSFSTPPPAPLS